jgi:spore germination cell wall hydrolase CwlJ-like protein
MRKHDKIKHKIKLKFNKVLDFELPMLLMCLILSMLIVSCDTKADEYSVRTDVNDILTEEITSTKLCLVTTLYFESRSESDMANIMVLNTIFNRVNSKHFPNNPCGVIKQPKQYSFTHDGLSDRMVNLQQVVRLEKIVDKYLLNREVFISLSEGVNHYHTVNVSPAWNKSKRMKYVGTFDQHIFYRRE